MSLYTRIPMPYIEWDRNNTKYVLTVLPFSGLLTGAAEAVWYTVSMAAGIHAPLFAAVSCALPLLINGGIHLDGLADTADACASHAPPDRRREILADPHTGAFGAAAVVMYEIFLFGIYCELFYLSEKAHAGHLPLLFVISFVAPRAMAQMAAALLPPSSREGLLYTMTFVSDKWLNIMTGIEIMAICTAAVCISLGAWGLIFAAAALLLALCFTRMTRKGFGGISGDLCGWLIKMAEAVILTSFLLILRFT